MSGRETAVVAVACSRGLAEACVVGNAAGATLDVCCRGFHLAGLGGSGGGSSALKVSLFPLTPSGSSTDGTCSSPGPALGCSSPSDRPSIGSASDFATWDIRPILRDLCSRGSHHQARDDCRLLLYVVGMVEVSFKSAKSSGRRYLDYTGTQVGARFHSLLLSIPGRGRSTFEVFNSPHWEERTAVKPRYHSELQVLGCRRYWRHNRSWRTHAQYKHCHD